jgi:hypothetical protein
MKKKTYVVPCQDKSSGDECSQFITVELRDDLSQEQAEEIAERGRTELEDGSIYEHRLAANCCGACGSDG